MHLRRVRHVGDEEKRKQELEEFMMQELTEERAEQGEEVPEVGNWELGNNF